MKITRSGDIASSRGPADYFTGTVRLDMPFEGSGALTAATVTFEPGARTNWHTHPLGQTLLVTFGRGRVQREGGAVEEIAPGDIVSFAPDERHWHAAAPETAMTHIAIAEKKDGSAVTWLEPVSDADYRGEAAA
ncbi:(R)-mandelonitrile lyase [Sphingomonas phyllosphaerae]|uniref:(R)-mandelonitrile lyase n=1 Tax=Sphingomonas phyllosphaerae TaxID=257003 RepID=UPI0024136815|nr:cupin domain-containing protein [Sphingomonas phyllosphaerae]